MHILIVLCLDTVAVCNRICVLTFIIRGEIRSLFLALIDNNQIIDLGYCFPRPFRNKTKKLLLLILTLFNYIIL